MQRFASLRLRAFEAMRAGRIEDALGLATSAIQLRPRAFGMIALRAEALAALGRNEEALRAYSRSLAVNPDQPKLVFRCARILGTLGRHREALEAYERLVARAPNHAGALLNRGNALRALRRVDEAMASYRRAIELKPGYPQALNNLGNALQSLGRYEEAIDHYERALAGKPDYVDALNNRGNARQALGRYREAIADYDQVLERSPGLPAALWNKGTTLLHLGLSREAWLLYEHRLESDRYGARLPQFALPVLGEQPVKGRRPVVQWEARFGDVLQMLRYVPGLQAAADACWLQVAPPLRELVARSFPRAQVIGIEAADEADCRIPYASLPLAMRTFSDRDIPANVPYLVPDPAKVEHWKLALRQHQGRRIGLAWRGNPVPAHRSASLDALQPLFRVPRIHFVALQKGLSEEERDRLQSLENVTILDDELATFDDTAAVVSGLDLVITVDTAVAHLAGALARPVWVLLKLGADWRWRSDRDDSSWYPTARLFRQQRLGDWEPVVWRLCQELQKSADEASAISSNRSVA